MATFTAQLQDFEKMTLNNMRWVAAEAIQDVVEAAQTPQVGVSKGAVGFELGKIPVAEGDLIASLVSRIAGGAESKGQLSYTTAIAGFELGQRLEFEWTMAYALRIEAGFVGTDSKGRSYNQQGRHYVGHNAANFSSYVDRRVAEVRT